MGVLEEAKWSMALAAAKQAYTKDDADKFAEYIRDKRPDDLPFLQACLMDLCHAFRVVVPLP